MKNNNNQHTQEKNEQNDELFVLENVRKAQQSRTHRRKRKQTRFLDKISNDPFVMNA